MKFFPARRRASLAAALALAGALALGHAPHALAAGSDALQALIDQGKYWQAHGRSDLAEQAWKKVLGIDAKQPDALLGMGFVMADRKDGGQSAAYLDRLRQVAPNYPGIDELGRRLGQSSPRDQTVNDARRLAQSGHSASAVEQYQKAMDGAPATPELRLEYYQALAATPNGWDQARKGLEALARDNPDDPRYALAYAQHLTYRDVTRRDGIARLQQLTGDAKFGRQARESWRQALLWLAARPSDQPMFDAYFKLVPNDPAVKARYDAMVLQEKASDARSAQQVADSARGRAIGDGFAALDRNDLATARARFNAVLAGAPNDTDALGGLGIVELKQEHFREARNDLERASRGGDPSRWREALKSAGYWSDTSDALVAQNRGDVAKAKSLFEHAIATDPSEPAAQLMLGELLLANHDPRGAEQAYRMALRRQADNPDAIRGLVGALAAQGRGDEALQFANQLTAEQQAKAGGLDRLRGTAEAAQARAAEAQGDLGRARSLFEDALVGSPDDPWLRLDLARIYVRQGAVASARSMMDGLLAAHPDMPDALYAGALLAEQTHDYGDGLRMLDRVAPAQRTAAMGELQRRLWLAQQSELAGQMARRGQNAQALAMLRAAEPVAQADPAMMGQLAGGYLAAGDPAHAMQLVQGAMAAAPADLGLRLQYANLLLANHQDGLLGDEMRRLQATPMSAAQHAEFDRINLAIVVRRADLVRQSGDLAGAYAVMAPWLAAMPEDPDLQGALARLYTSAGDPANALTCYRIALRRNPGDAGLRLAALYAASGARAWSEAEQLAQAALAAAPDDPVTLAAVGRMYRAEGKLPLAAQYLKRSLVASSTPVGARAATVTLPGGLPVPRGWEALSRPIGANPLPGTNPFEGKTAVDVARDPDAPSGSAVNFFAPAGPARPPRSILRHPFRPCLPTCPRRNPRPTSRPPRRRARARASIWAAVMVPTVMAAANRAALRGRSSPMRSTRPRHRTRRRRRLMHREGMRSRAMHRNRMRRNRLMHSRRAIRSKPMRSRKAIRSKAMRRSRIRSRDMPRRATRSSSRIRSKPATRPRLIRSRATRRKAMPSSRRPMRRRPRPTRSSPTAPRPGPCRRPRRRLRPVMRPVMTRRPARSRHDAAPRARTPRAPPRNRSTHSSSPITARLRIRSSKPMRRSPMHRAPIRHRPTSRSPIRRSRPIRSSRQAPTRHPPTSRRRPPATRSPTRRRPWPPTARAACRRRQPTRRRSAWPTNWRRSTATRPAPCRAAWCSAIAPARKACRA